MNKEEFRFKVTKNTFDDDGIKVNSEYLGVLNCFATTELTAQSIIIHRIFGNATSGKRHYISDSNFQELEFEKVDYKRNIRPVEKWFNCQLKKLSNGKIETKWVHGFNSIDVMENLKLWYSLRYYDVTFLEILTDEEYKSRKEKEEKSIAASIIEKSDYEQISIFDCMK